MNQSDARYPFRAGAYAVAVFCFIVAGLLWFAPADFRLILAGVCLIVGFVMLTIGATGKWPPPKK